MATDDTETTWDNVRERSTQEWLEHLQERERVYTGPKLPPVLELADWLQEHCGSLCLDDRADTIELATKLLILERPGRSV